MDKLDRFGHILNITDIKDGDGHQKTVTMANKTNTVTVQITCMGYDLPEDWHLGITTFLQLHAAGAMSMETLRPVLAPSGSYGPGDNQIDPQRALGPRPW